MKTRKLLYWFAAIVLLGLIEYATATTNISSLTPDQITKRKALAGEVDSRVDSIIDRISHKVAEPQR